jgi:hypothetical protein
MKGACHPTGRKLSWRAIHQTWRRGSTVA